ncbi:MAG: DUF4982 domain-containing protein [Bacteroidales bacterium]|nr:DUF4982 domain-containing protein [Bacteroidales bacterium]
MKKHNLKKSIFGIMLFSLSFSLFGQGFGTRQLLNDDWSFHMGDIIYGGREKLDHSQWRKVDLPHDWSVEQFASPHLASCTGYLPGGIAWYRKDLQIPAERIGQQVYIYFEGIYNNSEVFINGKWLGKRPNGYISFLYDLTPYVHFGGKNVIAVRVDHSDEADSRWYTGSGIYRDVYLVYANPAHIGLWGVAFNAEVNGNLARITTETEIVNTIYKPGDKGIRFQIIQELLDREGNVVNSSEAKVTVYETSRILQSFSVKNPHLWTVESPELYKLQTKLIQNNAIKDESMTRVGFRTLGFDADSGFTLNGKSMKIKGVCIHHDAGCLGAAVPREVLFRRLTELKKLGCNAIRTSHNPQAPVLYDLCDEMGFLVMDEAFDEWEYPKKKWIEGWNVGEPGFQGSAKFFREWGKTDLADMVRRDRNHPSIIMWSIGNEVDYPNDPYTHSVLDKEEIGQTHVRGYKPSQPSAERLGEIAQELVAVVKQYDTSRPVTAALAGAVMSNHTDYPYALDVVGYNYTEDRYKMDHESYPDRILYGSENRRDYDAWRAVTDNDFIMGQFLWTGFDYLGEAGRWPSRGFTTGLFDLAGYPKPQAFFRKSLWSMEPMTYIGSYIPRRRERSPSMHAPPFWNYQNKEMVRVVCYTNCDESALYLNNRLVGQKQYYNKETGIMVWDIPFEEGTLEVRSYINGVMKASNVLKTLGKPALIIAEADKFSFDKKNEVSHIEISIVDEEKNLVLFADPEIHFRMTGNLELLGTENGSDNPSDNYKDLTHRCRNGRLLAYIRCIDPDMEGTVTISSPLFEDVIIQFY